MQATALDGVVHGLYAAATGAASWESPLLQLCQLSGATSLKLGELRPAAGGLKGLAFGPLAAAGAPAALKIVVRPTREEAAAAPLSDGPDGAGAWNHSESRAQWPAELTSPELAAAGLALDESQRWHLCWAAQGQTLRWLALALPHKRQPLHSDELQALERLAWHLPMALQLQLQMRRTRITAPLGRVLLERMHHPAWLVDGDARLLLANALARSEVLSAQRLLQDDGALRLPRPAQHKQLTAQLALLAQSLHGSRACLALGATHVQRSWLCLQALNAASLAGLSVARPLPAGSTHGSSWAALPAADSRPCVVLISLFEPGRKMTLEATTLAQVFALTPAQARVAALLAQGQTAAQVALFLGLQESTVRTHQRQVLSKLGLQRKIDLVRMLGFSGWLWRQMAAP